MYENMLKTGIAFGLVVLALTALSSEFLASGPDNGIIVADGWEHGVALCGE